MKRITAFILILCITLSFLTACASDTKKQSGKAEVNIAENGEKYTDIRGNDYVSCGKSGDLSLSFQPNTTNFKVENSVDGSVWYSNPENPDGDSNASKLVQLKMMSLLEIEYTNTETKKRTSLNLYTSNVKSGKYEILTIENGVVFKYDVKEVAKNVYLAVYLENGSLLTKLWYEDSGETIKNIRISAVSVLPYFVRGSAADNGYLLLPDGSGATVDFSKTANSGNPYSRPIYGYEPTAMSSDDYLNVDKYSVRLPVYGAKVNNSAVMAICEDGAEYATLTAECCGQSSSYARAYTSYNLLSSVEHAVGNYSTELFDETEATLKSVVTRYIFLSGSNADYSGMARTYRDYLSRKNGKELKSTSTGFYSDIYASVIKKVSTVGVPHDKTVVLTDAKQLRDITEKLNDEGIKGITVRYLSWNSDEIKNKRVDSAKAASGISIDQLNLIKNVKIYPSLQRLNTYSNGAYLERLLNASKSITQLPFSWKGHLLSNFNETDYIEYRVSVDWFKDNSPKMIEHLKNKKLNNLALGDVANTLYSDFGGETSKRDKTMSVMSDFIKKADESFDSVMLDSPNAYAATFADVIYNTPIDHSNQDILCKSVPFYSIVMSGIADCVAPAYNSQYTNNALLRTVAAGAGFCMNWIAAESGKLEGTKLAYLSNINFSDTVNDAVSLYRRIDKVYSKINGSRIYSHNYINNDVSVTEYENGLKIYVNFGNRAYVANDGTEVLPGDFVAREAVRQ